MPKSDDPPPYSQAINSPAPVGFNVDKDIELPTYAEYKSSQNIPDSGLPYPVTPINFPSAPSEATAVTPLPPNASQSNSQPDSNQSLPYPLNPNPFPVNPNIKD